MAVTRIIGCMIFWNDLSMLMHSLPALAEEVDGLICVDGPYAKFPKSVNPKPVFWPEGTHISTDGSFEYVASFGAHIVTGYWANEIDKRNAYLKALAPGDIALVVDADEVLEGELPRHEETLPELARLMCCRTDGVPPYPIFRWFRHTGDTMRYKGAHNALWRANDLLNDMNAHPKETLAGCRLTHLTTERDAERYALKCVYYNAPDGLNASEVEFRRQMGDRLEG